MKQSLKVLYNSFNPLTISGSPVTQDFASFVWEFFTFVFRDLFFPFYRFWYGESEFLGEKIEIELLKNFYLGTKTPDFDVFAPKWIFLRNLISIFFLFIFVFSISKSIEIKKKILKNDWKISRKIGLKVAKIAKIST